VGQDFALALQQQLIKAYPGQDPLFSMLPLACGPQVDAVRAAHTSMCIMTKFSGNAFVRLGGSSMIAFD
jgi:hypothetical protein